MIRVIGVGSPDGGDDAAGLLAARAVRQRVGPEVDVVEAASPLRVVDLLEGADVAIVVDAVRTGGGGRPRGTLVRAEADGAGALAADLRSCLSSHGLGLAEALGLAAALGALPRVVLHGVEVGTVETGASLSPEVRAAMPALVDAVVASVEGAAP